MREPDDEEIVSGIRRHEPDALDALYARYGRLSFGLAYRLLGDAATAEEVVQDAFLAVWRNAASFDVARGSARTWLLSIVRHRAIDHLRGRLGRERKGETDLDAVELRLVEPDPWGTVLRRLEADDVRRALASLPDEQRQAIELAFLDGLTHREIAERTGLPLGTVKGRLRLGLHRLRDQLVDARVPDVRGGSDEDAHALLQELLGAYALAALSPEEEALVEEHLRTCAVCRAELDELRLPAQALTLTAEPRAPSADLGARIRAAALAGTASSERDGHELAPAPLPLALRRDRRAMVPWAIAAALLLVSLAMLGWNLALRAQPSQETFALRATSAAPAAGGQITYLPSRQVMILSLHDLPALPAGKVYQVWLIRDGTPASAGVLGTGQTTLAVAADAHDYQTLAITVESGPLGSPVPTGEKVIVTPL
ncbi:MAG TPA: sigma-70 family RNA polymerase sigma factor [Thermomicrobiaceae bacterium]|nr:sigma-70 family RNA polymerase sigma factor [Thermomicrobiaceae bacterium]